MNCSLKTGSHELFGHKLGYPNHKNVKTNTQRGFHFPNQGIKPIALCNLLVATSSLVSWINFGILHATRGSRGEACLIYLRFIFEILLKPGAIQDYAIEYDNMFVLMFFIDLSKFGSGPRMEKNWRKSGNAIPKCPRVVLPGNNNTLSKIGQR